MNLSIKQKLKEIVGEENFTDDLIELVPYAYDASDHDHRPEAVVWPTHKEQVSQILFLANAHRFPVTPRGAGTGLSGGAVPVQGGLMMDLSKMNRILDMRIADRQAIVEPGVVYADLENALTPHGFFFPPDPSSSSVCTLGGNVATNAGGIRGAKYGTTRDYVLGLEVVLPEGQLIRTGSNCIKSASGLDLTRLFVGSEGTLGVITEITLKISPKPFAIKTASASFSNLGDAGQSVIEIIRSGIIPSALELLDENTIRVLRDQGKMDLPQVTAMILAETDGYTDGEASFQMDKVIEVLKRNHATDIRIARSTQEAEDLWKIRKSIGSIAAQLRTHNVSEDVTVPISKIIDLMTGISNIVHHYGLPFVIFGHAGDGNLHPRIMYDRSNPEQVEGLRKAVEEIFKLTCQLGGTLSGEHGIGLAKAPYLPLEHDSMNLNLMRAIKKLFDPNHILNPGKMNL
ncbi:MAG: FAD-binding protein [Syntrophaceae bacterium]|nr:FAD-binding protein [Syntrophaceae bacterium]